MKFKKNNFIIYSKNKIKELTFQLTQQHKERRLKKMRPRLLYWENFLKQARINGAKIVLQHMK